MAEMVAIAVIHGMGSQKRGYSRGLQRKIRDELGSDKASRTVWAEIYWADVLQAPQEEYLRAASADHKMDFMGLRRFMVNAFADAAAYRFPRHPNDTTTYDKVHARVATAISHLAAGVPATAPLIVFAHSLGGHVMSNYIWDRQRPGASKGLGYFESMRTHAGMLTYGCNIPFFTMAYRKKDIKPIRFPGSRLSEEDRQRARWLNFYDPDDVLGYPLRPINAAYRRTVDRDIAINVGGPLASWNPLSHDKYRTDRDFTQPAARFLATFLD